MLAVHGKPDARRHAFVWQQAAKQVAIECGSSKQAVPTLLTSLALHSCGSNEKRTRVHEGGSVQS
jgi:hypothetical protein